MSALAPPDLFLGYEKEILHKREVFNKFRQTSFITTFSEQSLTHIDIQNFIEAGLRIIRFKMSLCRKEENLKILEMLKNAIKGCCAKYELRTWPIAVSIDIPNACIRTGLLDYSIQEDGVLLKNMSFVEVTTNNKYWNKCNYDRIFMDDPYTFPNIKVGTELAVRFGQVVMVCTEILSNDTVRCQVRRQGVLKNTEFLLIRGVKHLRPPMGKNDMDLLQFALENKFDVIIVNCIRYVSTILKIKNYFEKAKCRIPAIVATICDQEGMDNFDEIVAEADAIVLAREFLSYEIDNQNLMLAIQLKMCAKCRSLGVPIYVSGNVLEKILQTGDTTGSEISDITNIILQGGGLFLRSYRDPNNVLRAMQLLNSICKTVETVAKSDFWDLVFTMKVPVNAAEACALGCAMVARQTLSKVIIVLTVTGKSAILVSRLCPEALIMTVSVDGFAARKCLLYRGILPLIYTEKPRKNWFDEMNARIDYATEYAVKHDILKYRQNYVVLRKSSPTSSYADNVSTCIVSVGENQRQSIVCEDPSERNDNSAEEMSYLKKLSRVLN